MSEGHEGKREQRNNQGSNKRSFGGSRDSNRSGFRGKSGGGNYRGDRNRDDRGGSRDSRGRDDKRGYKPRRNDDNRGGYRGRGDNDRGGFRGGRDRNDDRRPRRDGDDRGNYRGDRNRDDRGGSRDNRGRDDKRGYKPRRNDDNRGGYRGRGNNDRDNNRDSRGGYRGGSQRQRERSEDNRDLREERKGYFKPRSGGQFRRLTEDDEPIQRSLSGKPVPIRLEKKPVEEYEMPEFPQDEDWPEIPKRLEREIQSTARENEVRDVSLAIMFGTQAFEDGDIDRAMEFFLWAKSRARRSVSIREALGVLYYLIGDYENAQRELNALVRLTGRTEHNHILADCARATGNGDKVPGLIEAMIKGWEEDPYGTDIMNLIEGLIVLGGYWLEDKNSPEKALESLTAVALDDEAEMTESHLRLWHLTARAAKAIGDEAQAKAAIDEIKAVSVEWLEAMDKWIAGEDISDYFQPWAQEVELPEEYRQDYGENEDEDGDVLPEEIPSHLLGDKEEDVEEDVEGDWDPGDDWDDEDWDEEDPEPGIPLVSEDVLEDDSADETDNDSEEDTDSDNGKSNSHTDADSSDIDVPEESKESENKESAESYSSEEDSEMDLDSNLREEDDDSASNGEGV